MMLWKKFHPDVSMEHLGLLPSMLDENDPRPAREQFDAHYQHGGGWRPITGHKLMPDNTLRYPGDPPLHPYAATQLRNETIVIYEYGWVAIIQPDRSYEVCRMD